MKGRTSTLVFAPVSPPFGTRKEGRTLKEGRKVKGEGRKVQREKRR